MSTASVASCLVVPVMSSDPAGAGPAEVFRTFVSELAASGQKSEMLGRLRQGHEPDRHGWCSHPAHAHRWERHPCAVVRLANLVENLDGHASLQHGDEDPVALSRETGCGQKDRGAGGETRGTGLPRTSVGRSGR